jgi:hypothetical protein
MGTDKRTARLAGVLYLVVVITGMFSLGYVPSQLNVAGDGAATVANIIGHEMLFRLGIFASILCYLAFLFLPLVLYKLLSPVHKNHAIAMVALAVVSVPITMLNLLNKFAVLTLISKATEFTAEQLQAQVMLQLEYYNNGIDLATVFWGLWLLPFGYLVFKSGFLPKIFGILLMLGCLGYCINFIGGFLFSGYETLGIKGYVSLPSGLGEIGICLWLLIVGIRNKQVV